MAIHPRDAEVVDFDEGNSPKLARHGISEMEALQMLANGPMLAPNRADQAGKWKAVGYTNGGRAITLILTMDESRLALRPITGWDTTDGEKSKYLGKGRT